MIYFIFYIYDKNQGILHSIPWKKLTNYGLILECFQYIYEFLYGRTNAS